jgi:hypothetical protein
VGIFVAFAHRRTSDGSSVTEIPSSLELVHVDAAMHDIEPRQVRLPPFAGPKVVDRDWSHHLATQADRFPTLSSVLIDALRVVTRRQVMHH